MSNQKVWAFSVDISTEKDWDMFIDIMGEDFFNDNAPPIETIKRYVLSSNGWCHFMDLDESDIDVFMTSETWTKLRDSGLAIAIKYCDVIIGRLKGWV